MGRWSTVWGLTIFTPSIMSWPAQNTRVLHVSNTRTFLDVSAQKPFLGILIYTTIPITSYTHCAMEHQDLLLSGNGFSPASPSLISLLLLSFLASGNHYSTLYHFKLTSFLFPHSCEARRYLSVSGTFHLTLWPPVPFILLQMIEFYPSLRLNEISLVHVPHCLYSFIHWWTWLIICLDC